MTGKERGGRTPLPWRVVLGLGGQCAILAEQGPLTVTPATAHGLGDAAFLVEAVNAYEANQSTIAAMREALEAIEWSCAHQTGSRRPSCAAHNINGEHRRRYTSYTYPLGVVFGGEP